MDIGEATIEDLEEEIKCRQIEIPKMIDNYDTSELKIYCRDLIDNIRNDEELINNYKYKIVNCALETFYGIEIFEYLTKINKRVDFL